MENHAFTKDPLEMPENSFDRVPLKPECIPVGCIPTYHGEGVSVKGVGLCPGGVSVGGSLATGGGLCYGVQTDACENITLPQEYSTALKEA